MLNYKGLRNISSFDEKSETLHKLLPPLTQKCSALINLIGNI